MSPALEPPSHPQPRQTGRVLTCPPKRTPGCPPTPASLQPGLPACLPSQEAGTSVLTEHPSLFHPSSFTIHYFSGQTSSKEAKQSPALPAASAEPLALLPVLSRPAPSPWHFPGLAWPRPGGSRSASLALRVPGEWSFLQTPLGAFGPLA